MNIKKYGRLILASFSPEILVIVVIITSALYLAIVVFVINYFLKFFNLGNIIDVIFSANLVKQIIFVVAVLGAYVAVAIPTTIKYMKWSEKVINE